MLDELGKLDRLTGGLTTLMRLDSPPGTTDLDLDASLERLVRRWMPVAERQWSLDTRAWRHAPLAKINYGGNFLVGDTISQWYADPTTGALLDLMDFGVLTAAAVVLIRRRPSAVILVPAGLMVGGWISNLLDRLGLHYLTALGSVRGAVDFIALGPIRYNLADVFIVCATLLFILAVVASTLSTNRSPAASPAPPRRHRRRRTWLP